MLKIIVPPDSSGSTVPQIAGYDLEQSHSPTNRNGLQQLFSNEQNQGFPRTQRRHKQRCALTEFGRVVSPGQGAFLALSHSLREKLSLLLVVSAAWLPSRRWGVERSSSFYWVQKNLDIGYESCLATHGAEFQNVYLNTLSDMRAATWHACCQVRELFSFPRSYARNRSGIKLLLRHLLKPLQHLCQDLTP
ncbi:hypothetical protein QQF64_017189 [Cirrhinus molitorella]|uniref:Uncharacterized protein n=1 Tax=Cirrhinus molitorella TaxID=172907 RepID=A0ABR3LKB2_9TELE